jgi:DNA-binding GntR family transcriptional regulator
VTRSKRMRPIDARRSIGEIAAEHIREAILDNVYTQGERLIDSRIAAELGTSRGSIREALKLLQTQGLVVQKAHRGTFVISPSAEDIRDTCELRVALETHAVRLLALRPEVDLSALRALVDRMDAAAASEAYAVISQCDREFHDDLCRMSGSQRLHDVYVREVLGLLGFFAVDAGSSRHAPRMGVEFRPLLEAIEAGDGEAGARLIEVHIRRSTDRLANRIKASRS